MTIEDVRDRIKLIKDMPKNDKGEIDDYEAAHGMEDSLYEDVLIAIATNKCINANMLAKEALKSQQIEFERVCS